MLTARGRHRSLRDRCAWRLQPKRSMRDHDEKESEPGRKESTEPKQSKQPKRESSDTLSDENPQICRGYD
jgi:hypothetical protein